MNQDIALYADKAVWDQPLQTGQANLLQALRDVWPEGISSVLDVGCGDGKLTSRLAEEYAGKTVFVGLDSSAEALSRLPFSGVEGSAEALPFADAAFDLVMTTDALEHMDDAQEQAAWQELFRVAAKVVMVAVPFREDLQEAQTRCPSCGHVYHVNWHQRRYDIADLHRHAPPGWQVEATVLSGEHWSQFLPPETHVRRTMLGEYSGWALSVCPECGAPGHEVPPPAPLSALLAQAVAAQTYPRLRKHRYCRSHSEILVIFQRQSGAQRVSRLPRPKAHPQPATCIEFGHQPIEVNLVPFCQGAHCVAAGNKQLRLQFPLYESAPVLEVKRKPGTQGPLHLLLEDAAGVLLDGVVLEAGQDAASVALSRRPVPGYYGILGSCAVDSFASICLGQGPEIIWLAPPAPQGSGYWADATAGRTVLAQVSSALWLDPLVLPDEPPFDLPTGGEVLTQLETCCANMLTQARDALGTQRDELLLERDRLQVSFQNLEAERDALSGQRDALALERNTLSVRVQNLSAERDALGTQRDELLLERDRLQVSFQNLEAERDALSSQRDALALERNTLSATLQELTGHIEYRWGAWIRRQLKQTEKVK